MNKIGPNQTSQERKNKVFDSESAKISIAPLGTEREHENGGARLNESHGWQFGHE